METRRPYPSDVTDEEWAFVGPYLMVSSAPQRDHDLREVFNGLRWIVRTGAQWRMMPTNLPPWSAIYQQTQRWISASVFEAMAHDLRVLLRLAEGKNAQPTAVIYDGQTLQSTPESGIRAGCNMPNCSGDRAGYDGHKRRKGSKIHMAVDTLGHLIAIVITPANEQERAQVAELSKAVQIATGQNVTLAFVDQGYTGNNAANAAQENGIALEVIKLKEAKRGFVLLPRRWVVERSFAWKSRFRRLVRDYERLPETVKGLHFLAFAVLMLTNVMKLTASS